MEQPNPLYVNWRKNLDWARIMFPVTLVLAVILLAWIPRPQAALTGDCILGIGYLLITALQMRLRFNFALFAGLFLMIGVVMPYIKDSYPPSEDGRIIQFLAPIQVMFGGFAIWSFLMLVFKKPLLRRLEKTFEGERA